MKFEIENKKRLALVIFTLGLVVLIIGGAVYYFVSGKNSKFIYIQQKNNEKEMEKSGEKRTSTVENTFKISEEEKNKKETVFLEYRNQKYKYLVRYPNTWYVNANEAESDLVNPDPASGMDYIFGGQTFWSNYANIDDYDPQNKPENFRLLGLTVYRGNDEAIDDFAKKIGVFEDSTRADFKTESQLLGSQFIFTGLAENDLKITVILKNNKLFYVFKTAFINGDEQAAEIMENITKSIAFLP